MRTSGSGAVSPLVAFLLSGALFLGACSKVERRSAAVELQDVREQVGRLDDVVAGILVSSHLELLLLYDPAIRKSIARNRNLGNSSAAVRQARLDLGLFFERYHLAVAEHPLVDAGSIPWYDEGTGRATDFDEFIGLDTEALVGPYLQRSDVWQTLLEVNALTSSLKYLAEDVEDQALPPEVVAEIERLTHLMHLIAARDWQLWRSAL